ncbi:MAG TPA: type II toxin-antitoxin system PemK/MazF family toxin [Gemmataceae bacterium]|nr:type II toxin-antitoxin system PemK/MazF family toxin [Gemmataceae bacterium]
MIIVDFPFTDAGQSKVRPALIVQNDADNQRIRKTVIAMVTGNLRRRVDPSHVYVVPGHADGASSGLSFPSPVSCNNLFTIDQSIIRPSRWLVCTPRPDSVREREGDVLCPY